MTEDEGKQLLGKYPDFKMGDTGLKAIDEAAVADGEEGGYKQSCSKLLARILMI